MSFIGKRMKSFLGIHKSATDVTKVNTTNLEQPPRTSDLEDLSPIVTKYNGRGSRTAFLLHNVLTPQECRVLIDRSENQGFEPALVNVGNGRQVAMNDYRKSDRCIVDDPEYAEFLYQRILRKLKENEDDKERSSSLLESLLDYRMQGNLHAVGLNERLRVLRYDPGCYFKPHSDGSFLRGQEDGPHRMGEVSEYTILLYLNEGYQGGHTHFLKPWGAKASTDIVPRTGSVLVFEHDIFHEGATLESGRKYVLRTDLMYTSKGPGFEYSKGLFPRANNPSNCGDYPTTP